MKTRKLLVFLMLFLSFNNFVKAEWVWRSPYIYMEDCCQWCDQLVVPIGTYYKHQIQGTLSLGNSYTIIVRDNRDNILYSGYATYTENELWDNDNLIGFQNIDHNVPIEDQEEIMGDDYCDDDFDVNPPVCIHSTFVFNFQVPDTTLSLFYIEINDSY